MNLAENLKKIRKDHNLSQEQLAEQLGVSRQSVSKWESNLAYPEMDKVLQICKLFNLNIDDLLNQDIKVVNENKVSKNNVNKFVEDFLDYVTKSIDLFTSMKFKQKIKCLFEQVIIAGVIALVLVIIGAILMNLVASIFAFLPDNIYFVVYRLLASIYVVFCLFLAIALMFHIFKVRYLDYYVVVEENQNEEDKVSEEIITKEDNKIYVEKEKERIIIRDPKHAEYGFIGSLVKCLLFLVKCCVALVAVLFVFSLIGLVCVLIISFLFVKTGLVFVGTLLILLACIVINLLILNVAYNFIISMKSNKKLLGRLLVSSLVVIGIGLGLLFIGISKFSFINDLNSSSYISYEEEITMTDNMYIENYHYNIEYVESNIDNIKIVSRHSVIYDVDVVEYGDGEIFIHYDAKNDDYLKLFDVFKNDINNRQIVDYGKGKIYVYASKANIDLLKANLNKHYNDELNYQNRIEQLESRNAMLQQQVYDLLEQLDGCEENWLE